MTTLPDLTQVKTLLSSIIDFVGDLSTRVTALEAKITVTPAPAPAPAPATIPAFTKITGAKIDGIVQADATLDVLVNALKSGSVLTLPAGHFFGTTVVKVACTIVGAGKGLTIIDCTGLRPTNDKGIFVPLVPGMVLKEMSLTGAHISDALGGNAAGVRAQVGESFDMMNVDVYNCDTAMLTWDGSVTLTGVSTHNNGHSSQAHEVYFGEGPLIDVKNSSFKAGPTAGHAFKSRAHVTKIASCVLVGNPDPTGAVGGSVLDVPEGGALTVIDSSLEIAAGAANHVFFGYGVENLNMIGSGTTVTLTNVVLKDGNDRGGLIISRVPNSTLILSGCTYTAAAPPQITGFTTVQGAFTKAV